jgi:hypothetical protein
MDLNLRKKLVKCYIWSIALYCAETWTLSESRSDIHGKFRNVLQENIVGDELDRSVEKWQSITHSQKGEEYPTYNKNKHG